MVCRLRDTANCLRQHGRESVEVVLRGCSLGDVSLVVEVKSIDLQAGKPASCQSSPRDHDVSVKS
jgi:hypothetical protein